jgi:hypothetical protein
MDLSDNITGKINNGSSSDWEKPQRVILASKVANVEF